MAAVPITIDGVLCDLWGRTIQRVKLVGEASITGLGVGGGPIIGGGDGDKPPEGKPPGIWGGPIDPYPGHPLPEPPAGFPQPPEGGAGKPPPPGGGWGYHPDYGWGYFPGTGGVPGPKS